MTNEAILERMKNVKYLMGQLKVEMEMMAAEIEDRDEAGSEDGDLVTGLDTIAESFQAMKDEIEEFLE